MALTRQSGTLLATRIARKLEERRNIPAHSHAAEWLPEALPLAFSLPFGPHHRWLAGQLDPDGPTGVKALVGAPRGSGKSTFTTVGLPIIAAARRSHYFHVIARTRADDAVRSVDTIEEHCDRLSDRYPWMAPDRRVEGELYLRSGAVIVPRGTGSAVRGLQRRRGPYIMRPDLFIGDDLETDASARSSLQVSRLERWVHATVAQLGGPPGEADATPLDILIAGTTLAPSSMMTRALDGEDEWRNWRRGRFPAEAKVGPDGLAYDTQQRAVPLSTGDASPGERIALWPDGLPLTALDRLTDPDADGFIGSLIYAQEYLLDPRATTDVLFPKHLTRWERPTIARHVAKPGASHLLISSGVGVDAAASKRDSADYCSVARVSLLLRLDESSRTPVHDLYIGPEVDRRRLGMTGLADWAEQVSGANGNAPVAYETNGGFLWGAQELRKRRSVPVRDVAASADKRTRAQPLTLWHEARRVIIDPALRGTPFDTEFHSFTGTGDLHDDQVDAVTWAAYLVTNNWRV